MHEVHSGVTEATDDPHRPVLISVEGLIGAGKSTFLGWLGKYAERTSADVELSLEKLDEWCHLDGHNIFESFCKDPARNAFSFQMLAMVTRLRDSDQAHECATEGPCRCFRFTERSPFSDYCFAKVNLDCGNMRPSDFSIYRHCMDYFMTHNANLPELVVYLRPAKNAEEVCQKRIAKRDRIEERDGVIRREYLTALGDAHDEVFGKTSGMRDLRSLGQYQDSKRESAESGHLTEVLVIDVSTDFFENVTAREVELAKIMEHAGKIRAARK